MSKLEVHYVFSVNIVTTILSFNSVLPRVFHLSNYWLLCLTLFPPFCLPIVCHRVSPIYDQSINCYVWTSFCLPIVCLHVSSLIEVIKCTVWTLFCLSIVCRHVASTRKGHLVFFEHCYSRFTSAIHLLPCVFQLVEVLSVVWTLLQPFHRSSILFRTPHLIRVLRVLCEHYPCQTDRATWLVPTQIIKCSFIDIVRPHPCQSICSTCLTPVLIA